MVQQMIGAGAMAIIRLQHTDRIMQLVEALLRGGVTLIEVSLNTPHACQLIRQMNLSFREEAMIGAGTVTSREEGLLALEAGARYLVSPVTDPEIIRTAHEGGIPVCMGAYTPTEIFLAHKNQADIIKVFPAATLGPAYIKAVKEPFPMIRLMPTGGISPQNAGEWIRSGADLLGIGGSLVDKALLEAGDFRSITGRAILLKQNISLAQKV